MLPLHIHGIMRHERENKLSFNILCTQPFMLITKVRQRGQAEMTQLKYAKDGPVSYDIVLGGLFHEKSNTLQRRTAFQTDNNEQLPQHGQAVSQPRTVP